MAHRIPDEIIERIRSSVDIVEIVSEHVPLKKRGRNYFGLCPFHSEKTPSFSVNPEKQIYHCFGCGVGGNVFSFLMELEKVSFIEAVRVVAQRAGISLPNKRIDADRKEINDELYRANQFAADYFQYLLWKDKRGAKARNYLKGRNISEGTAKRFTLGYAAPEWDDLLLVAARKSLTGETLEKAGLTLPKKGGGFYDRFRDRLMFPIINTSGRTIAFGARALEERQEPKYLNSPETPIYRKGSVLYGLRQAREAIRSEGRSIIVEGYTDLLRLSQTGIENAVASAGTALTLEQAKLLGRHTEKVTIVYDADLAGSSASLRGIDVLLEAGLSPEVVSLPEGHDPDSFVRDKGPDAFRQLLKEALPILDYKLSAVADSEDLTTVDGKAKAIALLVETVSKVKDEVKRSLLIGEISERLRVDGKAVGRAVNRRMRQKPSRPQSSLGSEEKALLFSSRWERELLKMMINSREAAERVRERVEPEDFSEGPCRRIAEMIFEACSQGRHTDPASLMDSCEDPALSSLISELSLEGLDQSQIEQSLEDHLRRLRWDALGRRIEDIESRLKRAQDNGDQSAVKELLTEHHTLDMERRSLGQKNT